MQIAELPKVNALLNGTSAILLVAGYLSIKRKRITVHKTFMILAVVTSALFLVSYITYHVHVGSVHFPGTGLIRPVYYTILFSHTFLALAVVPLVLVTLTYALKSAFQKHQKIARWTFPIWLYVSITGVIVYVLLYLCYHAHA